MSHTKMGLPMPQSEQEKASLFIKCMQISSLAKRRQSTREIRDNCQLFPARGLSCRAHFNNFAEKFHHLCIAFAIFFYISTVSGPSINLFRLYLPICLLS